MIIQFTVGNFKVFKEKATLDMRATGISEHKDTHIFNIGKEKLLKSAAIYGKNAAGKSKLIDAMRFMRDFVIDSSKESQSNESIDWVDPFRLSTATKNAPSFFDIEFYLGDICYRYGFKVTKERVEKEWLFERKKQKEYPLFLRIEDEFQIDKKRFKEGVTRKEFTRSNVLFLSLAAQLNGELSQKIIDWFDKITFPHLLCNCEEDWKGKTEQLLENEKYQPIILSILKIADLDIEDIKLKKINQVNSRKNGLRNKKFAVSTYHSIYNEKNECVGLESFDLHKDESGGTVRFFNLIGYFIDTLLHGGIIIADEMDSRLHTFLAMSMLRQFNKPINDKAQLICTLHDTNIQDIRIFRRDQIYFVSKNRYGASKLYSLVEYKTRNDHDYEKNYLRGRYAAIPMIDGSLHPINIHSNGKKEKETTAVQFQ